MFKNVQINQIAKFNLNLIQIYQKTKRLFPCHTLSNNFSNSMNFINTSPEENEKILKVINSRQPQELQKYKISKGRSIKIQSHLTKHGDFKEIEEVLQLDGFDVKTLEKFTKSILNNNIQTSRSDAIKKRTGKYTIPDVSDTIRSNCNTFASFHVGVSSVTWSRIKLNPSGLCEVTHWKHSDLFDKKLHLNDLVQRCLYMDYEIPDADCYILDNPQVAQATSPGRPEQININIQKSQLLAILSYALTKRFTLQNERRLLKDDCHGVISNENTNNKDETYQLNRNIFFMKRFLSARLYNTLVGSENVSTERVISELLENQIEDELKNNQTEQISIPENLRETYQNSERYQREFLGQALLLGLTFLRLGILKCPASIAKLTGKI